MTNVWPSSREREVLTNLTFLYFCSLVPFQAIFAHKAGRDLLISDELAVPHIPMTSSIVDEAVDDKTEPLSLFISPP